jgi:uncharacterized protein involved in exopolysaccharide biosynthesis
MNARDPNLEDLHESTQEGEEEGFDLEGLKDALGYVKRAPGRHPKSAATIAIVVAALGLTVAATMPRIYNVTVRLLAQKTPLSNLGDPNHQQQDTGSMRDVAAVASRRDNMIDLINSTNLVERFYATRPASLRFKDSVFALITGPQTDAEKLRGMVGTLEKRVHIGSDESSVTISVDWNDPKIAYDMASLLQKNFLDARYDTDVAMIQDGIHVLEDHAKTELDQVDTALADYEALRAARMKMNGGGGDAPAQQAGAAQGTVAVGGGGGGSAPRPATASAADADLAKSLEDTRRQIRAIEEDRQRQLEALRQQLTQAQLTLTPMHPTVIGLQKSVDAFSQPSPQLEVLKGQERTLMSEIAAPVAAAPRDPGAPAPAPRTVLRSSPVGAPMGLGMGRGAAETPEAEERREREDPTLTPAREHLEDAIRRYQGVMARIDAAKLDLDMNRRALRYRYSVATPAEMPRGPTKPLGAIIGLASVILAVLLAVIVSAMSDWFSGKLLETWEVRRRLKLEVLSELDPPV